MARGAGVAHMSANTALEIASLGGGVTASVLGGVAIGRATDANNAANNAINAANQADAAAKAAAAAANAAQATANAVGCALNTVASPSTPFSGPCP